MSINLIININLSYINISIYIDYNIYLKTNIDLTTITYIK